MKYILAIYFLSLSIMVAQQPQTNSENNSKTLEGFYDLSEMEMPTKLYLLDNNLFHYYAIFGSVDLEIYGSYAIENNELHLQPTKELLQPYILFARHNNQLKDSISINYFSPEHYREKIFFKLDEKWVTNPENKGSLEEVLLKYNIGTVQNITVNLTASQIRETPVFNTVEMYSGEVSEGYNDFIMHYNRYYNMRKRMAKTPLLIDGNSIISGGEKRIQEPLHESDKEAIINYISKGGMFSDTTISRDNEFYKIVLKKEDAKPLLHLLKNGKITEE
ncbi:hypothetical protein QSV08_09735 [Maribacter sp. BPC-D8]|uniref:hypothetical protein n=1 Tax=Maribacter sp. BPC-D8 TaxID=3053613 RepID=UPI002B48D833|nr:hypothetical protein [Maribacter sp. BPC-D8]WRI31516.1 hypothetical protein QSV08_09735 [Maribacter sp. BPC-D8]